MIDALHFIRPIWGWLWLPMALLLLGWWWRQQTDQRWQRACDPQLLPHLLIQGHSAKRWRIWVCSLAWVIGVFALMGPAWQQIELPVYRQQQARVVVLDLSPAMLAADVKPDRLTRAKYKIHDLLALSDEHQVGMVVFANEAYTVSPLTSDVNTLTAILPELSPEIMPVQGSRIIEALKQAQALLQQGAQSQGEIILITANMAQTDDIAFARQLADQGYSISVLGVGTKLGAPAPTKPGFRRTDQRRVEISRLDPGSLRQLAQAGGGQYATLVGGNQDLTQLLTPSNRRLLMLEDEDNEQVVNQWRDEGRWFILLLLPLAAYVFRKGVW